MLLMSALAVSTSRATYSDIGANWTRENDAKERHGDSETGCPGDGDDDSGELRRGGILEEDCQRDEKVKQGKAEREWQSLQIAYRFFYQLGTHGPVQGEVALGSFLNKKADGPEILLIKLLKVLCELLVCFHFSPVLRLVEHACGRN